MKALPAILLTISLLACGGGDSVAPVAPPAGPAPTVTAFRAHTRTLLPGQSASLSWSASGSLRLDPGGLDVTGLAGFAVQPVATTTYTLTVSTAAGSARASLEVWVGPAAGRYVDAVLPGVQVVRDLVYGSATNAAGQPETLRLDLYLPDADPEPVRPALVWIHGGGFVGGDKGDAQIALLARSFAQKGYVCASINYRLRSQAQVNADGPGTVQDAQQDAKAAVRWLRSQASVWRVDPSRIGIGGSSAGGYTALAAAYDPTEGGSGQPGYSSSVRAVVDLWGALLDPATMGPGEAPVAIVHGTLDPTVPFAHAEALLARAQSVDVPYAWHPLEGKGHAPWDQSAAFLPWITPFLLRYVVSP